MKIIQWISFFLLGHGPATHLALKRFFKTSSINWSSSCVGGVNTLLASWRSELTGSYSQQQLATSTLQGQGSVLQMSPWYFAPSWTMCHAVCSHVSYSVLAITAAWSFWIFETLTLNYCVLLLFFVSLTGYLLGKGESLVPRVEYPVRIWS